MGILSDSLGKKKELGFGKRPSKGSFGKKKSFIKPKRITTDDEKAYLNWYKEIYQVCFICGKFATDRHHIKLRSTDKKNHKRLLPLCREHHMGSEFSPHGTPKLWRQKISIDKQNEFADNMYKNYEEQL